MLTQMIGQGGWDVYVTGVNGFVGKEHGKPFFIIPGTCWISVFIG